MIYRPWEKATALHDDDDEDKLDRHHRRAQAMLAGQMHAVAKVH